MTIMQAETAADQATANNCTKKYRAFEGTYIFFPVFIEIADSTTELVLEIGKSITVITEEIAFLFQLLCLALQRWM